MSERIFGAVGLLVALVFVWQASIIKETFLSDAVGPSAFPYIIAAVFSLASLYFIFKPDPGPVWPAAGRLAELAAAVVVMIAYAELLPVLGFLAATALAAAYLTWRLGTRPLQSVLVGVLTSAGIYVVFHLILGLSLAKGPFGY